MSRALPHLSPPRPHVARRVPCRPGLLCRLRRAWRCAMLRMRIRSAEFELQGLDADLRALPLQREAHRRHLEALVAELSLTEGGLL